MVVKNVPNLYSLLQDSSLLDDDGLAYYHRLVLGLISKNNNILKEEVIKLIGEKITENEELDSKLGILKSEITSETNIKLTDLKKEITDATDADMNALKAEIIANLATKQDKIVGHEGQTLTFDADGNVIAIDRTSGSGGGGVFAVYHQSFLKDDWVDGKIRIPYTKHGILSASNEATYSVYGVTNHNTIDYETDTDLEEFKADIIAMYKEAIEANRNTEGGVYPVDENGYIIFTWEQIQLYLLEDTLMTAEEAEGKLAEYGVNWKNVSTTKAEATCTLEEYINSAYMPALDGPAAQFNSLSTIQNINAFHFRHAFLNSNGQMNVGASGKYDLFGLYTITWGAIATAIRFDPATRDIVVECKSGGEGYEGYFICMADI